MFSLSVFILCLPGAEWDVEGEVVVREAMGLVGYGAHSLALLFPLLAPLGCAADGSKAAAGSI